MCGTLNSLRFSPTSGRIQVNSQHWRLMQLKLHFEVRHSYWFVLFTSNWEDLGEEPMLAICTVEAALQSVAILIGLWCSLAFGRTSLKSETGNLHS